MTDLELEAEVARRLTWLTDLLNLDPDEPLGRAIHNWNRNRRVTNAEPHGYEPRRRYRKAAIGEAWREHALCRDSFDPRFFSVDKEDRKAVAKGYCLPCPVKDPCETYALQTSSKIGVWGARDFAAIKEEA